MYWTKPDSSGVEVVRESKIDESRYTEFVSDFKNTYFKEVYDKLSTIYKLGRVRLLLKEPRSTLSWQRSRTTFAYSNLYQPRSNNGN